VRFIGITFEIQADIHDNLHTPVSMPATSEKQQEQSLNVDMKEISYISIVSEPAEPSLFSQAAVLSGPYLEPYTISQVPVETPKASEAVILLSYSGVCHGDIYSRDGGGPAPKNPIRPLVGGHEGVGTIVALSELNTEGFQVGDLVGIAWRSYVCGTCEPCMKGAENHCYNQKVTGAHRNGTFQSQSCPLRVELSKWSMATTDFMLIGYITFPTAQLIHIPPRIPLTHVCPILCAGVTRL